MEREGRGGWRGHVENTVCYPMGWGGDGLAPTSGLPVLVQSGSRLRQLVEHAVVGADRVRLDRARRLRKVLVGVDVTHVHRARQADAREVDRRRGHGGAAVVDDQHSVLRRAQRLRPDHDAVRVRHKAARVACPRLRHADDLFVADDVPHLLNASRVRHVEAEHKRARHNGPRSKVRAVLRVVRQAADLKHVGVRPRARARQRRVALELHRRHQVRDNAGPLVADVARRPEEVVRAVRHVAAKTRARGVARRLARHSLAPVAVLNHDRTARLVQQLRPPRQVAELATAVKLDAVESVVRGSLRRLLHVLRDVVGAPLLVLSTDAVVAVPPNLQTLGVSVRSHAAHARETVVVDQRLALGSVERRVDTRLARLPVVVQADVVVAEVEQALAAPLLHHRVHHTLHQ
eukprot:Rhum_TRINITY_DN15173_c0_g1::Rhum_TRINITY_DN15173_c0_g1_i1::g.141328::m.141328